MAYSIAAHDGKPGFYPLPEGLDALDACASLIDITERGIDMQYFLMKPDEAGLVLAGKLIRAADRGVRIRFLLDHIFTTEKDERLMAPDDHPNIEIRLFNPGARGGIGWLNFPMEFKRANRRMHNKSFTLDNQATIVGGRNIAEECFQLKPASEFVDFDVLGFGPVAPEVSETYRSSPTDSPLPMAGSCCGMPRSMASRSPKPASHWLGLADAQGISASDRSREPALDRLALTRPPLPAHSGPCPSLAPASFCTTQHKYTSIGLPNSWAFHNQDEDI